MRLNTFIRYNFLTDVWALRESTQGGEHPEWTMVEEDLTVNIVSGRGTTYMYTRDNIEVGARLNRVRNHRGDKLFVVKTEAGDNEVQMYVNSSDPVIDVYGNIVGFRQVLRRTQPNLSPVFPATGN